jgi:hypothetical protein
VYSKAGEENLGSSSPTRAEEEILDDSSVFRENAAEEDILVDSSVFRENAAEEDISVFRENAAEEDILDDSSVFRENAAEDMREASSLNRDRFSKIDSSRSIVLIELDDE